MANSEQSRLECHPARVGEEGGASATGVVRRKGGVSAQEARRAEKSTSRSHRHQVPSFRDAAAAYQRSGGSERFLGRLIGEIGHIPITDITSGLCRELAIKLYPTAKNSTRNRQVIGPIRSVLNFASEEKWGPVAKMKSFAENLPEMLAADEDWLNAFMANASENLSSLALMGYTTGARVGELVYMRWDQIDLVARLATVRRTKNGRGHTYRLTTTLCTKLAALRRSPGHVFGYECPATLRRHWKAVCMAAGIPYIPPHQAGRHAFATRLICEAGVDVVTTARLGNWRSPRVLMERYVQPKGLHEVVERSLGQVGSSKTDEIDTAFNED